MIKKLSRGIAPIVTLVLMLGVTAAIILYQKGYYDISFIERPEADAAGEIGRPSDNGTTQNDTEAAVSDAPTSENTAQNTTSITTPEQTTSDNTQAQQAAKPVNTSLEAAAFLESLKTVDYYEKRSYDLTDTDYASEQKFASLPLSVTPQKRLSLSNGTRSYEKWNDDTDELEKITETYARPVIELYMGMMFYDDGKTVGLLDDNGDLTMVGFEGMEFAYERDAYERPLIIANNSYYYVSNDLKLTYSDFNPAFGYPVRHDSQVGYNEAHCGLYPFYVTKTVQYIANYERMYKLEHQLQQIIDPIIEEEDVKIYGYMDAYGNVVIEPQYYYAYNFGPDGYAVVAGRDRVMKIIDTRGRTVIDPSGTIIRAAELNNRNAILGYYLPATDDASQLGSFYFDNGLIRVRRQLRDYFDIGQIVGDKDMLIYTDGTEFPIPEGYDLAAYSDGVLLLGRDGRYGCLDNTGRWIAQPVYTYAGPFSEGLCVLGYEGGKCGMIDTEGNVVIPFVFDYISDVSGGRIALYESSIGWSVIQKMVK